MQSPPHSVIPVCNGVYGKVIILERKLSALSWKGSPSDDDFDEISAGKLIAFCFLQKMTEESLSEQIRPDADGTCNTSGWHIPENCLIGKNIFWMI